jgi:hypothetical protein
MNLVCYNDKYALFSDESQTYLLEMGSFTTKETLDMITKIAYLQYGTGIAALACQSKVRIYGTNTISRLRLQAGCLRLRVLPQDNEAVSAEEPAGGGRK